MAVLNNNFRMREVLKKHWRKCLNPVNGVKKVIKTCTLASFYQWFPGIYYWHLTTAFLKSSFETVWTAAEETLDGTCRCRFREQTNVSPYLIKFWQMAEGNFMPMSNKSGRCFHLNDIRVSSVCTAIRNQRYSVICVNDTGRVSDWLSAAQEIRDSFETILPERSSFELPDVSDDAVRNVK